jgi:hypothetical protein
VRSGAAGQASTFAHVYVFVSLAALAAGVVGLALVLRPAQPAAEAVTAPVSAAPAR